VYVPEPVAEVAVKISCPFADEYEVTVPSIKLEAVFATLID
jgi:hypothetical protein